MAKPDARTIALLKRTFVDFQPTLDILKKPIVFSKAKGCYYWDNQGRKYFDGIGGIFVASLGHGHPRLLDALRRQSERMTFAPPLHGVSDVGLDFVEKLGSVTPGNLKFVKGFSGGSESTEAAMKFTRQYHRQTGNPTKYKFISRYSAYHGSTFAAMAASGTGKRKSKFDPQMGGFLKVFPPSHYRDLFPTWAEACRFAARQLEDVIVAEDPTTVAGFIVEPIGNTGGIITPTEEYYEIIRDICTRHNVTLIFDEVITGFAKTGSMFAAQTFGVTPDIICSGKGLSSGVLPLGALMAREDMGETFLGTAEQEVHFSHGNTYANNPLASAVGIAVIDEIVENKLDQRAQQLGALLRKRLEALRKYDCIREVRGRGILLGVELAADSKSLAPFPALGHALKQTAIENGLVLRVDPTWFAVAPAVNATEAEIEELADLVEKSLVDALKIARP
eukprot:TRINITY_DN23378_c0_g1_i1.p1 TRINITY_DN23378_c0_g1~~TRINITY_DN23378_c0_g1_i1.p1  ORF type:complete len:477 (+),score=151.40 TRINITY_DN23378_c0_g1_i1:87-1433(+)